MKSIDQGKAVIIIFLELSVAFDTNVLFPRLKDVWSFR